MRNGNGRKWKDEFLWRAYDFAREGLTDAQIAKQLGVRLHHVRRWMREKPAFDEAIKRGRKYCFTIGTRRMKNANQARFLAAYAATGVVKMASEATGIQGHMHYRWLREDPDYMRAFEEAEQMATDELEAEARRRALYGVKKMKFYRGQPIVVDCEPGDPDGWEVDNGEGGTRWVKPYVEHEFSDSLMILLLKAKRPEEYRDKPIEVQQTQQTLNVGIDMESLLELAEGRENVIDEQFIEERAKELIDGDSAAKEGGE